MLCFAPFYKVCCAGGGRCKLMIALKHSNYYFPTNGFTRRKTGHYTQCVNCRRANTQHQTLIKPTQQHVTTLMTSLHLFQAVPQLMSSLKGPFASMWVVNTAVPDAVVPCLRWLQAYGVKQQVKFTAE